jgi:dolichol-phosphate mannosyltransferase
MAIDLAAFSALLWAVSPSAARGLAIWLAMTWNFALNRRWTFSGSERKPILRQYGLFCLSCLLGALVNWSVSLALISHVGFFETRTAPAAVCGIAAGTVSNFFLCLRVVFRDGRSLAASRTR